MAFHCGPRSRIPVTNGLVLSLDASSPTSYPGTGRVWYDMSPQRADASITGSITYVSNENKSYFDYGIANDGNYFYSALPQNYVDVTVVFQPDFTANTGFAYMFGQTGSFDNSLRFTGVNGSSPWFVPNPGNLDDWSNGTATTYYLNGNANTSTVTVSSAGWNVLSGYRTNTSWPTPYSAYIGAGYFGRGFQARIAAVFAYNRQLTAAEQLLNHQALKLRFEIP